MRPLFLLPSAGIVAFGLAAGALAHAADRENLAVPRAGVSVRVGVTTYVSGVRRMQSFTLTCNPRGGSLPFAARICEDIKLHPKAMVDPPTPGPPPDKRSSCSGGPFMPQVSVRARRNGRIRTFSGSPGCDWPGGQAIAVYFDAAEGDARDLPRSELELRCDEDPTLFTVPTPLASVAACRHGLWTAHAEQLIRIAAATPELAALGAAHLFPHDVGALPCTIHAGGPYPGSRLAGTCGVTIRNPWATATVSFTEDWHSTPGRTARHIWHVAIKRKRVIATSQSGTPPPQLWK
jgi:hypothetical protein